MLPSLPYISTLLYHPRGWRTTSIIFLIQAHTYDVTIFMQKYMTYLLLSISNLHRWSIGSILSKLLSKLILSSIKIIKYLVQNFVTDTFSFGTFYYLFSKMENSISIVSTKLLLKTYFKVFSSINVVPLKKM